jgi:hypothetical protein
VVLFAVIAAIPLGIGLFGALSVAEVVAPSPAGPEASAVPDASTGDPNPIAGFARDLLAALGDPATAANVDSIVAWAAGEGSCARFNPLDTTQAEPGAEPFNTLPGGGHVWNYPSLSAGIQATLETLTNGLYQPILDVLGASGGPAALQAAVRATPWGTLTFGSSTYRGATCGSDPSA